MSNKVTDYIFKHKRGMRDIIIFAIGVGILAFIYSLKSKNGSLYQRNRIKGAESAIKYHHPYLSAEARKEYARTLANYDSGRWYDGYLERIMKNKITPDILRQIDLYKREGDHLTYLSSENFPDGGEGLLWIIRGYSTSEASELNGRGVSLDCAIKNAPVAHLLRDHLRSDKRTLIELIAEGNLISAYDEGRRTFGLSNPDIAFCLDMKYEFKEVEKWIDKGFSVQIMHEAKKLNLSLPKMIEQRSAEKVLNPQY